MKYACVLTATSEVVLLSVVGQDGSMLSVCLCRLLALELIIDDGLFRLVRIIQRYLVTFQVILVLLVRLVTLLVCLEMLDVFKLTQNLLKFPVLVVQAMLAYMILLLAFGRCQTEVDSSQCLFLVQKLASLNGTIFVCHPRSPPGY